MTTSTYFFKCQQYSNSYLAKTFQWAIKYQVLVEKNDVILNADAFSNLLHSDYFVIWTGELGFNF